MAGSFTRDHALAGIDFVASGGPYAGEYSGLLVIRTAQISAIELADESTGASALIGSSDDISAGIYVPVRFTSITVAAGTLGLIKEPELSTSFKVSAP